MRISNCHHISEQSSNDCFKLIDKKLLMVCSCDICETEFFREPTPLEILKAQELKIIS